MPMTIANNTSNNIFFRVFAVSGSPSPDNGTILANHVQQVLFKPPVEKAFVALANQEFGKDEGGPLTLAVGENSRVEISVKG